MDEPELESVIIFLPKETYDLVLECSRKNQRSVAEEMSHALLEHAIKSEIEIKN